ncbi:S8 family serine peptidase [Fictibacillus nanhaiensis]|uniref:S8 family serine peptidase n=1 Tax=Fictibacillus nanhaiensis TaxID=742169 RepID=UPI001C9400C6|nr:S8 family serine peptidase [Fictibacillus nanhaiensis]MBY6036960.1 S8 family serine peptidase [Fictibacillus nanhaiensis]
MKRTFLAFTLAFLTFFAAIPFSSASAETQTAKIDSKLLSLFSDSTASLEVIVTYKGEGAPTESQINLLKNVDITKGMTFESLPMAGVVATFDQVKALANHPEVYSIYHNQTVKYDNNASTALTGVDKLRTDDNMRKLNGGLPVSGKGIGVVVNDSGVDGTHEDHKYGENLVQNVMASTNLHALDALLPITYQENIPNTDSTGGHGTHVAGIVGGTGEKSSGKHEGVAPGANLIGYGSGAAIAILDTIGGFDYALTHQIQYNIRVITNSWGTTSDAGTEFDPFNPINVATKKLYDRGIVTVFSAGNSGPGESTISGNYKKAPWVITVAAGTKQGKLADFSSRGVSNKGGTVAMDGKTFTWEDRPTITAPGEGIISTRVIAPVSSLGATDDVENIEPAYLPFYTTMSGTSMAAPHIAGVVALLLEANPSLSPSEVKQIIQQTATNMPGHESWEVGAGYVNAYAAVDKAFTNRAYGSTLNLNKTFNANVELDVTRESVEIPYSSVNPSKKTFTVEEGITELTARINAKGLLEETGNTINLVLTSPDGTRYTSGISLLFTLYTNRTVQVIAPKPGTWTLTVEGLQRALALEETVKGDLTFKKAGGFTGLNDISGHPAEGAIKIGVSERLLDSDGNGNFRPDDKLTRLDLAKYLVMGVGVRQSLPSASSFNDVIETDSAFVEAVTAKGAALRDVNHQNKGIILPTADGKFSPSLGVNRAELAYTLIQSLGLQKEAEAKNNEPLTVQYGSERIAIEDAANIPSNLRGYVQLALDLNILNAYYSVEQGPYDLEPTVTATFKPNHGVTRGDYAVAITRYHAAY